MSCFRPLAIKDVLTGYPVSVPCGKCIGCLSDKRKMWSYRIKEELKDNRRSFFLTLTYNDEHLPKNENGVPVVKRSDVTNFFKRLRKSMSKYFVIRYFGCSEYGDAFKRPHYHIIVFINYKYEFYQLSKALQRQLLSYNSLRKSIESAWSLRGDSFGFIQLREVRNSDINYTAKYTIKEMDDMYPVKTFNMMSTRPYIGKGYVDRMRQWHLLHDAIYYPNGKYKSKLPRIYYEKIFPEDYRRTRTYFNERHQLDVNKIIAFFDNKLFGSCSGYTYIGQCDILPKDYDKYVNHPMFRYDFLHLNALEDNFFYEPDMLTKEPFEYYKEAKDREAQNLEKEKDMLRKYRENRKYKSEVNERLSTLNHIKNAKKKNS